MGLKRKKHKFSCGCEWDVFVNEKDEIIGIDYEPDKAPLNCPRTWELFCSGKTLGVFQLEKSHGQTLSRDCKPVSIPELSDLIAIMRPGCTEAILDDKSLTRHYIDRKHGREPVEPLHQSLHDVLEDTEGIMIYQEQLMKASQVLAGFDGIKSNSLRSACGKKNSEKMGELKKEFIDGCISKGILTEQEAFDVFELIKASQRYSFNKCLHEQTLVTTETGDKPIKDIKVGEIVESNYGWVKVKKVIDNGLRFVYHIQFKNNLTLCCTIDHKLETLFGLKPVWKALRNRDSIMTKDGPAIITKIAEVGVERTLDLEVDSSEHVFFANYISVSNSHSVSYAIDGYLYSAYPKAHFPRAFYVSQLQFAEDLEKVGQFIEEAKTLGVEVVGPDIRNKNAEFKIKDDYILYGLATVKNIGNDSIQTMIDLIDETDWLSLLYKVLPKCKSSLVNSLIQCGAFDHTGLTRRQMLWQYRTISKLNKNIIAFLDQQKPLEANLTALLNLPRGKGQPCYNIRSEQVLKKQLHELNNPPQALEDSIPQICRWENDLLGHSFTYHELDDRKTEIGNCTCEEFNNRKLQNVKNIRLPILIDSVRIYKIKRGAMQGQEMAFVVGSDQTGQVSNIVVFPLAFESYNNLLFDGNRVIIQGKFENKKDSLVVDRIYQI